jgi:hypothetical protein
MISQVTSTLIWSRARGLCSKCKRDVVDEIGAEPKVTGERAHITAKRPEGPRFDPLLTDEQRDNYANLILLCGSCHIEVDKAPEQYSVAKLQTLKYEHERECLKRLTSTDEQIAIRGEILSGAVDAVVEGLSLQAWDQWTTDILNPSRYAWPAWAMKEFRIELRPAIYAVLWPKDARALEIASKLAVNATLDLASVFAKRSSFDANERVFFCESISSAVSNYRSDLTLTGGAWMQYEAQIREWDADLEYAMVFLTKCVNFFADAVRHYINPRFRIDKGAFRMEPSRFGDESHGVYRFSDEEIRELLDEGR